MKKALKVAMLVAMMAVVLLSMTACGKTKIDIAEGMTVVFSGADGKGRAEIAYPDSDDTPPYMDKLLEEKKFDANDLSAWLMLAQAFTYEVDPSSGLSNGDTVTVIIDVDEAILENMDISAEDQKLTFTVEGLTEVIVIDAFEDFEINFTGTSPVAQAEFASRKEIEGVTIFYNCENNGQLKDGDPVIITARIDNSDYFALKETEKTFTVSNVDKLLTQGNELHPETLASMKSKSDAIIDDQIQNHIGDFSINDYEYIGYEFWGRQSSPIAASVNKIYLYYKINTSEGTYYYYVVFKDILQYADGTQTVDLERYGYPAFQFFYLTDYPTLESRTEEERQLNVNFTIEQYFG